MNENIRNLKYNRTYLTIKEAAKMIKVSEQTIRRWIKQEKFKVVKIEQIVRINYSVFMEFLNNGEK